MICAAFCKNRCLPKESVVSHQTVIPTLRYADANRAITWLHEAFGITEHFVVRNAEGRVEHAQLAWRGSLVMLGEVWGNIHDLPHQHGSISMTAESAEQVDAVYEQAIAAGATVVQPLEETEYGSHAFTVADYEGNHWHLGTYDPITVETE